MWDGYLLYIKYEVLTCVHVCLRTDGKEDKQKIMHICAHI